MNGLTPNELKTQARQRLSQSPYHPKKLTLWYSGIALGLSFLAVILSYATDRILDSAGGLSAMGTRAILDTVSTVFSLAVQIVAPLLSMGFLYCCIRFARQAEPRPQHLTMGLRRWAVILRHGLLIGTICLLILYLALQIASILFMFMPGSTTAVDLMYAMMDDPAVLEGNIPTAQLKELVTAFLPVYIISGVLFALASIPVSYRLRLSTYRILEDTPVRATKAVLSSVKLMKGNCLSLFKLDLSFWWFYLLKGVFGAAMLAIPLLTDLSDVAYVALSAAYCLAMLVLEYTSLAYVQTTYALFYDTLLQEEISASLPKIEE